MNNIVDADGNPIALDKAEQEVQGKAININAELSRRREILNGDMLASLIAPRARFECDFPKYKAYFFTIDGVLNGRKVIGAMFTAECILVFAEHFLKAQELANSGLRSTVELLHKEYETRSLRGDDLSPVERESTRTSLAEEPGRATHFASCRRCATCSSTSSEACRGNGEAAHPADQSGNALPPSWP